jgi:hypothetical protein
MEASPLVNDVTPLVGRARFSQIVALQHASQHDRRNALVLLSNRQSQNDSLNGRRSAPVVAGIEDDHVGRRAVVGRHRPISPKLYDNLRTAGPYERPRIQRRVAGQPAPMDLVIR